MHVLANDAMRLSRCEGDVAGHLRVVMGNAPGAKAEWSRIQIAGLPLEAHPINRAPVEPRRRPGLEPASAQPKLLQRFTQQNRRRFSRPSRRILLLPAMNQPVQESTSSNDDRISRNAATIAKQDAAEAVVGR